jgi:hypothetical protein
MDHLQIATDFVARIGRRIDAFRRPGGRLPNAGKTELSNIVDTVMATANDPDGRASIKSVHYSNGKELTKFAVEFNTADARQAVVEIECQSREIAAVTDFDHEKKLLTFYQSSRKDSGKTGEKGIIEDISAKPLSVLYASDLAKQRIRHVQFACKLGWLVMGLSKPSL